MSVARSKRKMRRAAQKHARAMIVYHQLLSVGAPAVAPPARTQFDGGARAPAPTQVELNDLATRARTPADHRVLAEYYLTLETRETTLANEHARMANMHRVERRAPRIGDRRDALRSRDKAVT